MGEVAKRRLTELSVDERASTAHRVAMGYARGKTYTSMSREEGLTTDAIKTLIDEHAAYVREARPDTKSLQEQEYRQFYGEMAAIDPLDGGIAALVRSTSIQARLQLLTRLDKILGHESPTKTISMDQKTLSDAVGQYFGAGGAGDNVSPMDAAKVQDAETVEGEVVEEDDE